MKHIYQSKNNISSETNQKDIVKGQKIVAATYMLTKHLNENDPIKNSLRTLAIDLVSLDMENMQSVVSSLETVLGGAVFAGLISEKNSSVLIYEIKQFSSRFVDENSSLDLENFFPRQDYKLPNSIALKDNKKTSLYQPQIASKTDVFIPKNDSIKILSNLNRQDKILSFINERKSAVIKDITTLFPDVSEKTIQRELTRLIDDGKITKRGDKRWSIYMAVNSLL